MATPENSFIAGVHRHVQCYAEKMANPYRGGTPDVWYSGTACDLWIEYKFVTLPKKPDTLVIPSLSSLQKKWLQDRSEEGRHVAVVVGTTHGGVVLKIFEAFNGIRSADFRKQIISRKEIAVFISNFVNKIR